MNNEMGNGRDLGVGVLNNYRGVGRSGSNPKLPSNTKLLLIRTMIIEERYQRTTKSKEIMCKNE